MPKQKGKNSRNTDIRAKVLETALHLYSEKGYFNSSIHDIQKESGVSMGSIYNYFAGREAIAKALYDDLLDQMEALVDSVVEGNDTAYARGRAIVQALFEATETDAEMVSFVLNARHREFLRDEPPICSSKPFVKLRDIVINGMKNGEIRDMDPWLAASFTFGPALRMIVLRLDGMIPEPLPEQTDKVWDLVWSSITTDPQPVTDRLASAG